MKRAFLALQKGQKPVANKWLKEFDIGPQVMPSPLLPSWQEMMPAIPLV